MDRLTSFNAWKENLWVEGIIGHLLMSIVMPLEPDYPRIVELYLSSRRRRSLLPIAFVA